MDGTLPSGRAAADQDAGGAAGRRCGARDLAGTLIPVEYAAGAFRVGGFVQRPGDAQPTGRRTQLFVNGRPFKDPFLIRAAEAGYRSAIHPGDRPSLLLRIEVAAEDVDVNVHPAKLEVRFRDRIGVERVVEEAVRHALGALVAAAPVGDWRGRLPAPVGEPRLSAAVSELFAAARRPRRDQSAMAAPGREPAGFEAPLLQLFDTYILYQGPEGVVIVDQHSAHERVLYEAVMAQLSGAGAPAQRLLLPLTLELTDEELDAVEPHGERAPPGGLRGRGVRRPGGGGARRAGAAPALRRRRLLPRDGGRPGAGPVRRLGQPAGAVRRHLRLPRGGQGRASGWSEREMRELLLRLFATDLPPHDVHGRATIVQLPREELERRFGRR